MCRPIFEPRIHENTKRFREIRTIKYCHHPIMVTGSFVKLWFHEMALEFLKDKTTCQFFFLFLKVFVNKCMKVWTKFNHLKMHKTLVVVEKLYTAKCYQLFPILIQLGVFPKLNLLVSGRISRLFMHQWQNSYWMFVEPVLPEHFCFWKSDLRGFLSSCKISYWFSEFVSACLRSYPRRWWPTLNTLMCMAASRRSSTRFSGLWCTGSPFSMTTWAESPNGRLRLDRLPIPPSMGMSMMLMDSCRPSTSMRSWCGGTAVLPKRKIVCSSRSQCYNLLVFPDTIMTWMETCTCWTLGTVAGWPRYAMT